MSASRSAEVSKKKAAKPPKPYPEFPLYPNGNGQWSKKIAGKPWNFGVWADPDAALRRYLDEIDDIRAGRDPRRYRDTSGPESLTVADMFNLYLESQDARRVRGEITDRHFSDCLGTCERAVKHFGRNATASSLRAADFSAFRNSFPATFGIASVSAEIARTRAAFRWAAEAEVIPAVPNYGPDFKKPGRRDKRLDKAKKQSENGRLDFSADEIRILLSKSSGWLRAAILLGVNCGFGNRDCSALRPKHVDFENGWFEIPRNKTGIPRRSMLWKETRQAIQDGMQSRPAERQSIDAPCFLTSRGRALVNQNRNPETGRVSQSDNVSKEFRRLLIECDMKRPGRNFYSLRRTFETVAGGAKDQPAVDLVMGHSDESMAAVYRQGIDDDRLIAVAEHVRNWLYRTDTADRRAAQ